MMNAPLILLGKLAAAGIDVLKLGAGSTWPGHIALKSNPNFIRQILSKNSHLKTIIIAGTNGKTTTALMLKTILQKQGKRVFQNASGANLLNGIASSLIENADAGGNIHYDYAIFEVDENTVPLLLKQLTPNLLVLLNLFRDQLDRYGEVHTIASNWKHAIENLPDKTALVLNADDPEIAYLGKLSKGHVHYFGTEHKGGKAVEHASDSIYCPKCHDKLDFETRTYSHLGDWHCENCSLIRPSCELTSLPSYPLSGTYNKYNAHASVLTSIVLGVPKQNAISALKNFQPAFGRQETITVGDKKVQIFLSKNPASFNQSLETIMEERPKSVLFVLNDQIPDGRDVSWIWDTDLEQYDFSSVCVFISGDRAYDMGLRVKYAQNSLSAQRKAICEPQLTTALHAALNQTQPGQTLYVLPTYSAMLDTRKILKGRSIL